MDVESEKIEGKKVELFVKCVGQARKVLLLGIFGSKKGFIAIFDRKK